MADAWGGAWGSSWGNSWLAGIIPARTQRGDDAPPRWSASRPIRVIYDESRLRELLGIEEEEPAPKPTAKRKARVAREIVETAEVPEMFRPRFTEIVRKRVVNDWKPRTDWAALAVIVNRALSEAQAEADRIAREIEDEDELILLWAA